jgi:hypothetical protein
MTVKQDSMSLLKRVRQMCLDGQVAGAELELHSVYRQAGCSPTVRIVLAALLARRGREDEAKHVLNDIQPHTAEQTDPQQTRLAISILIGLGRIDETSELGRAYYRAYGHEAAKWLRDMSVPDAHRLHCSQEQPVDELAHGLAQNPRAIQALVSAQHYRKDLPTISLLRKAIRRIVPLFENDARQMTAVCRAMAELALLAGDQAQARRWAHRGLEENPYCASLAMLINSLRDEGDTALPARTVLACVAEHYPQYPDIQAALILRENAEGQTGAAQERLALWLEREPYSPKALELQQDLAA